MANMLSVSEGKTTHTLYIERTCIYTVQITMILQAQQNGVAEFANSVDLDKANHHELPYLDL